MIYIIFTEEGLSAAVEDIEQDSATVWLNPELIESNASQLLQQKGITVEILPQHTDPANEKAVIKAVEYVESQTSDKEILVEYL